MDAAIRTQIILASVASTGPVGDDPTDWQVRVAETAARITAMCSESSPVSVAVEGVERSKVFTAVVEAVRKEQSSTRAVVTLKTRPSQFHPDGLEEARSERTDNPVGLAMARRLVSLRGHRVALWVEVESTSSGSSKVRVVRHVEDLGPANAEAPEAPEAAKVAS